MRFRKINLHRAIDAVITRNDLVLAALIVCIIFMMILPLPTWLIDALIAMGREARVAIMCAEAVPWRCHRSLIADAPSVRDVPVVEILSETSAHRHKLTPFAQVHGTAVTYPPEQARLL